MSIHDRLAEKARVSGKTSAQFHISAQNKANVTWFFAILSCIVWYFSSWPWAIIIIAVATLTMLQSFSATMIASKLENYEQEDVKEDKRLNGSMPLYLAEKIIQEYGAILQEKAPAPGCVSDINMLPYPKIKIKEALIIGLKSTTDPKMKEMLKIGYTMLSRWQEGVGESDLGIDLSNPTDNNAINSAQKILSMSEGFERFSPIITAETNELMQELIDLGLW